jgi:hypothetical protein
MDGLDTIYTEKRYFLHRHFDGASFKPRKVLENAQTPTTCPGVSCRGRCMLCWASVSMQVAARMRLIGFVEELVKLLCYDSWILVVGCGKVTYTFEFEAFGVRDDGAK